MFSHGPLFRNGFLIGRVTIIGESVADFSEVGGSGWDFSNVVRASGGCHTDFGEIGDNGREGAEVDTCPTAQPTLPIICSCNKSNTPYGYHQVPTRRGAL